jgi:hypothetical protein
MATLPRGPDRLYPETKNRVLEVERNDRIILDNQHVIRQGRRVVWKSGFHDLADKKS